MEGLEINALSGHHVNDPVSTTHVVPRENDNDDDSLLDVMNKEQNVNGAKGNEVPALIDCPSSSDFALQRRDTTTTTLPSSLVSCSTVSNASSLNSVNSIVDKKDTEIIMLPKNDETQVHCNTDQTEVAQEIKDGGNDNNPPSEDDVLFCYECKASDEDATTKNDNIIINDNPVMQRVESSTVITFTEQIKILNEQLKAKDDTIASQKQELKQYISMADKYRSSMRKKNALIRGFEKQSKDASDSMSSPSAAKSNSFSSFTMEQDEINGYDTNNNSNKNDNGFDDGTGNGSLKMPPLYSRSQSLPTTENSIHPLNANNKNNDNNHDALFTTIRDLKDELTAQQQIVKLLTDENNTFRKREVSNLEKITMWKEETERLRESVIPAREALDETQQDLKLKKQLNESLVRKTTDYEEELQSNQLKIADLGQEVMRLQSLVDERQEENDVFEKMLSVSRKRNEMENEESKNDVSPDDTNEEPDDEETKSGSIIQSLKNDLEFARQREKNVLRKISLQLDELGAENTDPEIKMRDSQSSIMEQLSESQQEAIVYLSGEVDDLRKQLEVESAMRQEFERQLEVKNREISNLFQDAQVFAKDALAMEQKTQELERNYSMKLGEFACLRDELSELELRVEQLPIIEASLKEKEEQCEELDLKIKELTSQATAESELAAKSKNDKATRELSVLKKALKQKYERMLKESEHTIQLKNDEISQLKECVLELERAITKNQEDIESERRNRLSFEFEAQQDKENMSELLKERDYEVRLLKRKIIEHKRKILNQNANASVAPTVSDSVMDGVMDGVNAGMSALISILSEDEDEKSDPHENEEKFIFTAKSEDSIG